MGVKGTGFYRTNAWIRTREAYYVSVNGLCERCMADGTIEIGKIVHHKEELTMDNMNDLDVAFGFDNLELLCQTHHNQEHFKKTGGTIEGLKFNEKGELVEDENV